jgi:hypothetical protein
MSTVKYSEEVTVFDQASERCCVRGMYPIDTIVEMHGHLKTLKAWDKDQSKHTVDEVKTAVIKLYGYIDDGAFNKGGFKLVEGLAVISANNMFAKRIEEIQKKSAIEVVTADSVLEGKTAV